MSHPAPTKKSHQDSCRKLSYLFSLRWKRFSHPILGNPARFYSPAIEMSHQHLFRKSQWGSPSWSFSAEHGLDRQKQHMNLATSYLNCRQHLTQDVIWLQHRQRTSKFIFRISPTADALMLFLREDAISVINFSYLTEHTGWMTGANCISPKLLGCFFFVGFASSELVCFLGRQSPGRKHTHTSPLYL